MAESEGAGEAATLAVGCGEQWAIFKYSVAIQRVFCEKISQAGRSGKDGRPVHAGNRRTWGPHGSVVASLF